MLKKYKYGIIATCIALVIILGFVFYYRNKYQENFIEHNTNEDGTTGETKDGEEKPDPVTLDSNQFGFLIGTASLNTCSISSVCCLVIVVLVLMIIGGNSGNSGNNGLMQSVGIVDN